MIILKPHSTSQEVKIYAREHTIHTYTVTVIDEGLHDSNTTTGVSGTYTDGVLTIDISHNFIKDNFYAVQVYSGGRLIAFHKIYITSQDVYDKYTVLDGYYNQIDKPKTNYIVKPTI